MLQTHVSYAFSEMENTFLTTCLITCFYSQSETDQPLECIISTLEMEQCTFQERQKIHARQNSRKTLNAE